jgi:predicted dehydrogenase
MHKKIRVGIIGLGRMGMNHLNILSFLNSVEVVFVSDLKIKNYNKKKIFFSKNPFSLLHLVDAVIIATPTTTHFDIIKKCGKKIKNIFVEKPLAHNFSQTKKIINFAKKNKINLRVGFVERFNPAIESLLKIIETSKKIISCDFTRANALSDRIKDVDVITDLMVHDIDLAILINGKVKSIKSSGFKRGEMIVYASAILQHYNGTFSRILASRVTQKKIRLINIVIKNKYIECNLLRKELYIHINARVKDFYNNTFKHKSFEEIVEIGYKEALQSELQAFINSCFKIDNKNLAHYLDSYEVMRVCEKIKKTISLTIER